MIISDWYSDSTKSNESIKVTIRFLSNEVRGDSLKIILHKKVCKSNQICNVTLLSNSKIDEELRSNIIRKAALLQQESKEKKKINLKWKELISNLLKRNGKKSL